MHGQNPVPLLGLVASFLFLYWHVLAGLVRDWRGDGDYSHGFFVVPIAAYFVWQRRAALTSHRAAPSIAGLAIIVVGVAMLAVGVLGAELFVSRLSMLVVLGGVVTFTLGWAHLRMLALPLAFLLLMIPLPAIIFNQIAFPLQLIASSFGEFILRASGIAVLREGNVIRLAGMDLEVAEACSGIRSLFSLLLVSIVYAHFAHRAIGFRIALVLSTIPVAIMANGIRVAGTGLAAHYFGSVAAEGFFHEFGGWLVFAIALAALFVIHRVLMPIFREPDAPAPRATLDGSTLWPTRGRVVAAAAILIIAASELARGAGVEPVAARTSFADFPIQLAEWSGAPLPAFDERTLATLGADEYVNRVYRRSGEELAALYIGFYGSQRQGDTMHSPLNCLPGAGWMPVQRRRITVEVMTSGSPRPIDINRFVIEKGLDRQLVLYWYQSRGRVVASEYWGKVYTVLDAVRLNRTDGALVRVVVPFEGADASAEPSAERAAIEFVKAMFPTLRQFLPT